MSLILPKSESSNTTCAVSLATSAPDPIAIEQSDSFIANMSFTLPKTVYFFTAFFISS